MSQEIFDVGGGLYLTLPDPVPSRGDLEGWTVRHVTSAHSTPETCRWDGRCGRWVGVGRRAGTVALTASDVDSFNGVLRFVGELSADYGYRPRSSRIGANAFRWTWERVTQDGHRVSDMVIVSRIH